MAARIPDEIIQAVTRQLDIVEIVGKYVSLTKRGRNFLGLCPFHAEKTPSFTVSPDKQLYHCFGCGAGGHLLGFVMEMEAIGFVEAITQLADEAGISIPIEGLKTSSEPADERQRMIEAHELAAKLYHYILLHTKEAEPALAYLIDRGFNRSIIEQYQLGYAPDAWDTLYKLLEKRGFTLSEMEKGGLLLSRQETTGYYDRFRDRIMVPIRDTRGQTIGFGGRILGDGQPKYLNSPETPLFHKGRVLFNLDRAKSHIRRIKRLVLMEGYMDVMAAVQAGVEHVVAGLGTAFTKDQATTILRFADEIVLCYDGDSAGQEAALKNAQVCAEAGLRILISLMPEGKDPDDYIQEYGAEKFQTAILDQAVNLDRYRLHRLRRGINLQRESERLRYVREALDIIASVSSHSERELYLREVAEETEISLESLKQDTHRIRIKGENVKRLGDNSGTSWNNVRNNVRAEALTPPLKPAYMQAERLLLAAMMQDREAAEYVHNQIAGEFQVEAHAALAEYLHSYYAYGHAPDPPAFIASLNNLELERLAASLFISEPAVPSMAMLKRYVTEIKKQPLRREIKKKQELMRAAEQEGNAVHAAQIAMEIVTLERQLRTADNNPAQ